MSIDRCIRRERDVLQEDELVTGPLQLHSKEVGLDLTAGCRAHPFLAVVYLCPFAPVSIFDVRERTSGFSLLGDILFLSDAPHDIVNGPLRYGREVREVLL